MSLKQSDAVQQYDIIARIVSTAFGDGKSSRSRPPTDPNRRVVRTASEMIAAMKEHMGKNG